MTKINLTSENTEVSGMNQSGEVPWWKRNPHKKRQKFVQDSLGWSPDGAVNGDAVKTDQLKLCLTEILMNHL